MFRINKFKLDVINDGLVTGIILPNTGHFVVEEQTQATLEAMQDFFE